MGLLDPGNVVWFEISTGDGQAVQDFYGELLGWGFAVEPDSSVGGSPTPGSGAGNAVPDGRDLPQRRQPRGDHQRLDPL